MATTWLAQPNDASAPLLGDSINTGLAANDRVKYYLTLLQTANAHAREPVAALPDLRDTRQSSGVDDAGLDDVVGAARHMADGIVLIPGAQRIRRLLFEDIALMLEPLRAAAPGDEAARARFEGYRRRLDVQERSLPAWTNDLLDARSLDAFTSAGDETNDTVHRLLIDLHRELNQLLATVALESIDGARASGLTPEDRLLVGAFMKGLNATAALKFDHPGLGTTASRYGDRLSIQNDLGTTEGHIVVVHVDGLVATITYADVHHKRVDFLKDLLKPRGLEWEAATPAVSGAHEMIVGRFTAGAAPALQPFLTFLGSRLVFLIDWNRARKQLLRFVKKSEAVALLKWAADNDVGHRGFLQAGGVELIATAFERIAPVRLRYGARLDELVGEEAARAFLESALRITTSALQNGQSQRLIQDEIEAALLAHLESPAQHTLDVAAEHAMLIFTLAERVRASVSPAGVNSSPGEMAAAATLAKTWENRADDIVRNAKRAGIPGDATQLLAPLLANADDAADALEETAFLLTLAAEHAGRERIEALSPLAELVGNATREYVRSLECARELSRASTPSNVDSVLVCIDRIAELEHGCDAAERRIKATLIVSCAGFRELQVLSEAAGSLEQAADALARCAVILRDYALSPDRGRQ